MLIKVDWNSKKSLKEAVAPKLNDNFWKWFGNSKCVDKDGQPQVCIHRTKADFDTFDISKSHPMNLQGKGFYFSTVDSKGLKQSFGKNIKKCYLSIKNPFLGYGKKYPRSMFEKFVKNEYLDKIFGDKTEIMGYAFFFEMKMEGIGQTELDTTDILIKLGFDGIWLEDNDVWIAFYPNQIKSVDNNGEWSLTSDNINEWWSGGVNWQNDREGLGGVGATMDCHLFFFMFPDQFLNLCPKFSYGDDEFFNQYVADRKPIGIPFLWCDIDEEHKTIKVLDHEGRHRVKAVRDYANSNAKSQPDIPVAIIYNKDKYHLPVDLTELRKNWKIVGQKGDRTYNVGQFRVQNNLDNARIGLDNLYETVDVNVYHGSPNVFKKFDKEKLGTSTKKFEDGKYSSTDYGFFFTNDKEYASGYGENNYKCNIKLDNPLVVDMSDYIATEEVLSKFLQQAKNENKDGVIFKNIREVGRNPSTEYVVFNSDNIKILNKLTESKLNDNFWKWFGNSKTIKDGQPMVFYHGTPNAFTTFDISKTSPYGTVGQGFYFTDSKQTAENYIGGVLDRKTPNSHVKSCYLKMTKPYNFDDMISDSELASLSQWVASNNDSFWYKKILDDSKYNDRIKYPQGWNFEEGYLVPADQINREGITRAINWLYKVKALDNNNLTNDNVWFVLTDGFNTNASKRSLQQWLKQNKYDSVIYPIEGDNKGNGSYKNYCYVVFNPNQIKSIENKGLYSTKNDDINETLTEASNINQNFWNWFKGSKTVDEQGNPLIFYHGTKQQGIKNFKAKYDDGLIFFAYNEEFAKEWASNAPLTPDQEQGVRDFQRSDDLANYRKEVMARYKRDYGDNWADDDDIRNAAKWEIKEYEKQKYKQMGIEENVIPVYIKATKIFNPEKDYMKVIKEISDHWDLDLKADYKQEYNEAKVEYDKVNNVINKWFEEHKEYRNDSAMEPEFRKREDILGSALNKFNEVKQKIETRNNHLKRIMSGAWVYFENPETINKIWELGYDAIELAEHDGEISTLAVREGTNQVKSIFNFGKWGSNTNIFENF